MFFTFNYFYFRWYFYKLIFSIFCFYNNIFFSWASCIHWSFVFESYSIWILFRINALRCIWLFIIFIYWYILSFRLYNHYFSWYFRDNLISNFGYYYDIFLSWCCCIYWSFIREFCIFRECFRINTSFHIWLFFVFIYWHKLWITFYNTHSCRNFCNRITIFIFYNDIDSVITWSCRIYRRFWIIFKCWTIWIFCFINTVFWIWLFIIFIHWNDLWNSLYNSYGHFNNRCFFFSINSIFYCDIYICIIW